MNTINNKCTVFAYCDRKSHDNRSRCENRMDLYYSAIVEDVRCLYCAKCKFLTRGHAYKRAFYRDHEDHLREQSDQEKMNGIIRGNNYFLNLNFL